MRKQPRSRCLLPTALAFLIAGAPALAEEEKDRAQPGQPPADAAAIGLEVWARMPQSPGERTSSAALETITLASAAPTVLQRTREARDVLHDPMNLSRGRFFQVIGVGMFAASAADLASTELGLAQPGVIEVNPPQRNRIARLGIHAAAPALVWWTSDRLNARGKRKLAVALRIGFTVAYAYATLHNSQAMSALP